jgi:hypothetical protein
MVGLQVVMLGAPTSLASIMVVGPHHGAAVIHVGGSSGCGPAGAHGWFGKGSQESAGLSFCVLVAISPRRAKWGVLSRGMRSVDTPPPTPAAGAPPAGPWQEPSDPTWLTMTLTGYTQSSILRNTETASTHQSVSYLNAFPRCGPSMPGRPCCRFQGESPGVIAFSGPDPF